MADDDTASSTSTEDKTLMPPPEASVDGGKTDKEDPDSSRDSKRRKMCPKALEKIEEFVPPNRTFSFTFDTKFSACGSDATPKFGSFHSVKEPAPLTTTKDLPSEVPAEILETKEEEGGEEETDVLSVFEVIEGIELNNNTQFPTKMGQKNWPL